MFRAIRLSKSDPTPLYIQLANELSNLIDQGIIPVKTKLPTIRSLSSKLGINRDTVVSAYKLLETQGRVIAHIGSGTYVAPSLKTPSKQAVTPPITCSHIHFNKNLFSTELCEELLTDIIEKEGWSSFTDPLYRERHALKHSVCNYLLSVGLNASTANIRITTDLYTFFIDLLKLSHKIAICAEAYRDLTYTAFIKSLGFKIYDIPITPSGLDLVELEKQLKTGNISYIFVSSYLQNPTGINYSKASKERLLELADQYHCYIIEDGTFSDFSLDDSLTPLHALAPHRVIYIDQFSKLYLPHLSYSFVVLPTELTKKLPDTLSCTLNEKFLHSYIDSNQFDTLRQHLIEDNYKKFLVIQEILLKYPDYIHVYSLSSTLFFWLKPLGLSAAKLCELLIENNILVSPGNLFSPNEVPNYFRLSTSHLSLEEVKDVAHILEEILIQLHHIDLQA